MSVEQALSFSSMYRKLQRGWLLYHLVDAQFKFIYDAPPADEWVSVDCETTGLNVGKDEIISIGAVKIVGDRVMASERLELLLKPSKGVSDASVRIHRLREQDLVDGLDPEVAMRKFLHFVGSRPLVGYFLEFDVAMLNKIMWPMLGVRLPQPKLEVSSMFYDFKNRQLPTDQKGGHIDLRFATVMKDLDLPVRDAHDAVNDAVMAALAFIKLRHALA